MLEALVAVSLIAVAGCAAVAVQAAWPYRRYARLAKRMMGYVPMAKVMVAVGDMWPAVLLLLWNIVPLCVIVVTMTIWRQIRPRTRHARAPPGPIEESAQRHIKEFIAEITGPLLENMGMKPPARPTDRPADPPDATDKVVADALSRARMEAGDVPPETELTVTTGPQRRMPRPE
jgi:hypothetical protein